MLRTTNNGSLYPEIIFPPILSTLLFFFFFWFITISRFLVIINNLASGSKSDRIRLV